MNKSEDLINFVEDRPGHDYRYSMDSKKISDELGWNIKTNFDDGLKNTINWYLNESEIMNKTYMTTATDSTPWKSSN